MEALAGVFKNVYYCLKKHNVDYLTFSVSLANGIEIVVSNVDNRLMKALKCIMKKVPEKWNIKIGVKNV